MLMPIMRKKTNRFVAILVSLSIMTFGLSGCSLTQTQAPSQANTTTPNPTEQLQNDQLTENIVVPNVTEYTFVASESGQTALDLLSAQAQVQSKTYGFGTFIEGINGVLGNDDQYWAFYVNDQYAKEAADKIILQSGDKLTFRLEPVEVFPTEMSAQ